ncbi:YbjQ family protein [Geopseudomonas aromaticivorans]
MIVTNTSTVEGHQVTEYLSVLCGDSVTNYGSTYGSGCRDEMLYEMIREGRNKSVQQLMTQAAQRGADAIIGLTFEVNAPLAAGQPLVVSVTGTAVRLVRV